MTVPLRNRYEQPTQDAALVRTLELACRVELADGRFYGALPGG